MLKYSTRISALLLAIGGLFAALLVAPPATAGPEHRLPPAKASQVTKSIYKLTNQDRAKRDKRSVRATSCLKGVAQRHAERQAKEKRMFHQNLRPILKKCNVSAVGENVAYGYSTAPRVQRAWMNSKGHRANILNNRFNLVGIGVAKATDGTRYYTVVFGGR